MHTHIHQCCWINFGVGQKAIRKIKKQWSVSEVEAGNNNQKLCFIYPRTHTHTQSKDNWNENLARTLKLIIIVWGCSLPHICGMAVTTPYPHSILSFPQLVRVPLPHSYSRNIKLSSKFNLVSHNVLQTVFNSIRQRESEQKK